MEAKIEIAFLAFTAQPPPFQASWLQRGPLKVGLTQRFASTSAQSASILGVNFNKGRTSKFGGDSCAAITFKVPLADICIRKITQPFQECSPKFMAMHNMQPNLGWSTYLKYRRLQDKWPFKDPRLGNRLRHG